MFKFKFSEADKDDIESTNEAQLEWLPAEEIIPNISDVIEAGINTLKCGTQSLRYINPASAIIRSGGSKEIVEAENQHSDLIPSKYEGGFKVWEGTQDLATFLAHEVDAGNLDFSGKLVLDLGCGSGLLGILAMLHGAKVYFQDYNKSVLTSMTIPNVILNVNPNERDKVITSCRFYCGDWQSFLDLIQDGEHKFDLILTSETIYNPHNYYKVYSVIRDKLNKNGVTYLAGKVYYFGVGGGLRKFESLLQEEGILTSETCWKCSDGVQREILRITFP